MTIYIVDDNNDITEFLSFLLEDKGQQVHAFDHPKSALDHLKSTQLKPHILITDYNMPGMNGLELRNRIEAIAPEVKTIVISGRNVSGIIGGLHFLQKPFTPNQITGLIDRLISEG